MNKLIVESKNDKAFIEALIQHVNVKAEVDKPIFIDDFESLDGLNPTKLTVKLNDVFSEVAKKPIEKIGILLDIDNEGVDKRIQLINECLQNTVAKSVQLITKTNELIRYEIEGVEVEIACFFTNIEGKGELETVLKVIKNQKSTYADCLQSWKDCLIKNGKSISDKEFDKFWVSNYVRFDTCSNKESKQAGNKCSLQNFDYVLQKTPPVFDWEHDALNELKGFLNLFK
jgi:uncharacterized protein YqgV (UPF0045/DUF77 family)